MAKQKRHFTPWTCPKCRKVFNHPGRHRITCKGTGKPAAAVVAEATIAARTGKAPSSSAANIVTAPPTLTSLNGYREHLVALQAATKAVLDVVELAVNQAELYRRERDEALVFKQQFSALFESLGRPTPQVPRR